MDTRTFESELAHFGVKGMRWGVRKSARGGREKPPESEESRRAGALERKAKAGGGSKALTNAELNELVNRRSLEGRYKPQKTAGQQFATNMLKAGAPVVGSLVLSQLIKGDDPGSKMGRDFALSMLKQVLK